MECVVTGARGFVGRGLLPVLAAAGHVGIATGRAVPTDLPAGWRGATRGDCLRQAPSPLPDAVIHLEVEQTVPKPSAADPGAVDRVNVGGTRAWLDWAAEHGVRCFVFISSIQAAVPASARGTEESPLSSAATYGGSKARAEAEVRAWAESGAGRCAVILRPAAVYGPDPASNLLPFARRVIAGRRSLVGAGATPRSVVSRTNLTAAIAFALAAPKAGCAIYQVSDPQPTTVVDLATMIAELAHAPPPRSIPRWLAACATPIGDLVGMVTGRELPLSSARLTALQSASHFPSDRLVAAGFVHPQSTREGLAEMLAWMARPAQATVSKPPLQG
jgi:UDP-glucose 4-epimerase